MNKAPLKGGKTSGCARPGHCSQAGVVRVLGGASVSRAGWVGYGPATARSSPFVVAADTVYC